MSSPAICNQLSIDQSLLLKQARVDGNLESLAELLEFYRPMLERLGSRRVSRRLSGKVSPSEVSQVAIINASQRFGEFRGQTVDQFRAWLCTILEHAVTDQTRRFLARCRDAERETPLSEDIQQPTAERPSQIYSTQEQVLKLLSVVESLPPELRTIVRMRYQQDLKFNEIASFLGIATATVRRRWLDAVRMIEREML